MLIFGHNKIEAEEFFRIENIEDIKDSPNGATVLVDRFDIDIAKFCQVNLVSYTIVVSSIRDAIFANLLNAKYIIAPRDILRELMKIAEYYLFDTKVLVEAREDEIVDMARVGVDGVILVYGESR
jgi:hypothetical protein